MKIVDVQAFPTSFRVPKERQVSLGIGTMTKRDCVMVKVTTEDGLVGWGESHHARAPGSIGHLINTTLRGFVVGMDATDTVGIWARIYKFQLGSHGMGAGTAMAMSGIDQALWDIKGKATGWPLYKLLGGSNRPVPAYAGGISLGYQPPDALVSEAEPMVAAGYRALKLRVGDNVKADMARMTAIRRRFGDEVAILTDANTGYTPEDVRRVMPAMDDLGISWLEEPFPAHDHRSYRMARGWGRTPLACGENHYTRFEFHRLIEDGIVSILQPDLSKTGGITEALRIAAAASMWKLPIHPHSSMTGLNHAVSIHFLAAIDNGGYFEADLSVANGFRDQLCSEAWKIASDGTVRPLDKPGIGVEIDEAFLAANPVIEGPGYV
ncbi:MAG: mandelate racemase/muconate lactonizing enzyme family protein [Alphaproteobacteria bacterium]|nr:mandelate racemase/muconate lactonizing enzyme family protein [Alphaproteobacteria bacterium]